MRDDNIVTVKSIETIQLEQKFTLDLETGEFEQVDWTTYDTPTDTDPNMTISALWLRNELTAEMGKAELLEYIAEYIEERPNTPDIDVYEPRDEYDITVDADPEL